MDGPERISSLIIGMTHFIAGLSQQDCLHLTSDINQFIET